LQISWNVSMIFLSIFIALASSFISLNFVTRMDKAQDTQRTCWFVGSAIVFGIGAWSTHFIGAAAHTITGSLVYYDPVITVLSLLVASIGPGVAFTIMRQNPLRFYHFLTGGTAIGLAIVLMHYLGMKAMQITDSTIHFDLLLFGSGILSAITTSTGALWLAFHPDQTKSRLLREIGTVVLMGTTILSVHYLGTQAIHILPKNVALHMTGHTQMMVGPITLNDWLILLSLPFAFSLLLLLLSGPTSVELKRELHQAQTEEARKSAVLQSSLDATIIIDSQGIILEWNKAAGAILGYDESETLGQALIALILPKQEGVDERLRNDLSTLNDSILGRRLELIAIRKNKEEFPAELSILPVPLPHPPLFAAILRDITKQKRAERKMKQALTRAEENARLRSTFVSALTHDLRTPLLAQKRALAIFESEFSGKTDTLLQGLVTALLNSNDQLLDMVNKLLESYQYEDELVQLVLQPIQLHRLVSECITDLYELAKSRSITLENDVPTTMPPIEADLHQLRRLLINLVSNAVNHIQEGGMVWINATIVPGQGAELSVSDNGPGIPPDILPYLFERYPASRVQQQKIGSGLGLYICKVIAELHSGEITAESVPGQGACFTLKLPRAVSGFVNDLTEKVC
jgi:PAS domain S-box-containing protein